MRRLRSLDTLTGGASAMPGAVFQKRLPQAAIRASRLSAM